MDKSLSPLIILIMILAACAGGNGSDGPAELQISDPAKVLEAFAGNEFKLIIESNPTTGYNWELVETPDPNVVEFISTDYRGDEPVVPGSGGVDIWTFKAVSPGQVQITFGYQPPSNEPASPQQTVTFTVIVK